LDDSAVGADFAGNAVIADTAGNERELKTS
jgi:hypothetical protein